MTAFAQPLLQFPGFSVEPLGACNSTGIEANSLRLGFQGKCEALLMVFVESWHVLSACAKRPTYAHFHQPKSGLALVDEAASKLAVMS